MSLLVHLPFIEDLKNKGLIELPSFSKNGFTSNANGKLGSCYSGHGIVSLSEEILGNAWSVATWVKSTATWPTYNYIIFCKNISTSTDCQIYFSIINGNSLNLGMNDDTSVGSFSYTFELNIWYHVAATYDGETYRLYINGSEVKSGTSTLPMVENRLHLGIGCRSYNAAGTSATGQADGKFLNDFRLYNNAISAREVKELSKGLVAHWKLDDPYVEETTNLVTSSTTGSGQITRVDDTLVTSGENKDTYFRLSLGAALVAGTTYTVSMYCRGMADGGTATFGVGAQSGDNRAALWTVQNGHNECTFIVPTGLNGATSIMFDDTNRVGLLDHQAVFSQIQVERKDHATGYIAWGTSRAKGAVYDSSGYCHDGTLSPTPPTFDSDSARYSGCMKFSSNYIHCGQSNLYPTDEITVAWWGYMNSWGSSRPISCTETGGWNFEQGDGGGWRFPVYKNGIGYAYSVPAKKWADYTSGWHFFVGTFDGYVSRIYVDGELDSTSTNGSPTVKAAIMYRANVPIYIGCEANGANPSSPYFNGKLSDIRIYATALSAEDIKELYNTSASIDDHHNVYARELVED